MNMRDPAPALAMLRRSLDEAVHPQTVRQILARRGLNAHYQPIVQLKNGLVTGHESLIRGPVDSPLRMPDALFKAVSEGAREFTAIAIASRDAAPWPCGACRQVLNEFAPNIRVLVTWQGGTESATLPELLPHGFGPQQLTTKE